MQDKSQWHRETAARAESKLDARFIVQSLPGLGDATAVAAAVEAGEGGLAAFAKRYLPEDIVIGRYVIVMDAADRSMLQIVQQERPGLNGKRMLFQQLVEAVVHLHTKGYAHGDIKMLNAVRLAHDARLRLIDLDCAARIQKLNGGPASFLGSKFSSATLPPEMLFALDNAQKVEFEKYWAAVRESSSELWSKVAPKRDSNGLHFVVKTYRVSGEDDAPVDVGALPYEPVKATVAVDIWALGALLYNLCAKQPLAPSTRDDDLISGDAMKFIANWDDATAREALLKVRDPAARDLCSRLLRADPIERRDVDLEDLLKCHPFFEPKGAEAQLQEIMASQAAAFEVRLEVRERTKQIHGLARETKHELSAGLVALKRRIGAAADIKVPTVFVIKEAVQPDAAKSIENTVALFDALKDTIMDPVGCLKKVLGEKNYELWLCCEACYMPQEGEEGKWPYPMRVSSAQTLEFAARVLPLARAALQAAVVINGLAGIGRLLGYPVPQLPASAIVKAREQLGFLEQETSVADFQAMEKRLHSAADKVKLADKAKLADAAEPADAAEAALVGPALREFERFLDERDPGRGWCGSLAPCEAQSRSGPEPINR
jgi:hypothetical protein